MLKSSQNVFYIYDELVSSNLNVITVSLENSRRIRVARQTGDLSVDESNVDKYAGRQNFVNVLGGDIMDMNLEMDMQAKWNSKPMKSRTTE